MQNDTAIASRLQGRLEHHRRQGAIYFVTWRVHASRADLVDDERQIAFDAILHFAGVRFDLHAAVVMNDHAHVVAGPHAGFELEELVHSWKSFSANRIQRALGAQGCVWQKNYFDRVLRTDREVEEKVEYTVKNPWKRWPDLASYPWVTRAGGLMQPVRSPL